MSVDGADQAKRGSPLPSRRSLLTPPQVRRLLRDAGLAPLKSRGQTFVVDPNTVRKVVRDAGVRAGDLVCEVGPGLGSLTLALREVGARVVAVEVDPGLARVLREVVGDDSGVRVVHADALDVDWGDLLPDPALLVANLPYNLATPILFRCLLAGRFTRALLMVQRQVGQRWTAAAGDPQYGAVSVKVASLADARVVATVSRAAFYPVPNVDSVTVQLLPRPWKHPVEQPRLFALVEAGFAQRRKRLRNALAAADHEPARVEGALVTIGRDPGARAEELDLDAWLRLATELD